MGDAIIKLPIDNKLEITNSDRDNLSKFFNIDISSVNTSNKDTLFEMSKFVLLVTLLYYICSHSASIGRFVENKTYKLLLQTVVFGSMLFIYVYFFNY